MGISKLRQDLMPYAEEICLGHPIRTRANSDISVIRKVVIDGPSLVYYAYARLYPRYDSSVASVDAQPSYKEINSGVAEFLAALITRQIDIEAIYFDGALPAEKQTVRLQRLERARAQLENYRKQNPGPFKPSVLTKPNESASISWTSIWKKTFLLAGCKQTLPQPPFIVPSVLDHLRNDSAIRYPVLVVPGEADSYCAAIAKTTGAAVLSNDSDIVMYDLGSEGSLVLLDTLNITCDDDSGNQQELQSGILKAQRFRPLNIARRLGNTMPARNFSLLRFGFERARDPSATTGAILSRCIMAHCMEPSLAFEQFDKTYRDSKEIGTVGDIAITLLQLDPRLAELYCQYNCTDYIVSTSQSPHVYMPLMIEDPTRDSSWTYGRAFRVLAYALLHLSAQNMNDFQNHGCVVEYQKRGPRIVGLLLKLLNRVELLSSMETIVKSLKEINFTTDSLLQWRTFCLKVVNEEKVRNGKATIPFEWAAEFLSLGYMDGNLSWYDIHIYANIQAVLYSLWMLKQGCAVSKPPNDLRAVVDNLNQALRPLVSLQDLMSSRWDITTHSQETPSEIIAESWGRADLQSTASKKDTIHGSMTTESENGIKHATSKARLSVRDRRLNAKGNIFELLNPS